MFLFILKNLVPKGLWQFWRDRILPSISKAGDTAAFMLAVVCIQTGTRLPLTRGPAIQTASYSWKSRDETFNSLATGRFEWKFRYKIISNLISVVVGWGVSCEIALRWMSLGITEGKFTGPDSPKPLPEPILTKHPWGLMAFIREQFHWKCPRYLFLISVWKVLIQDYSHISLRPMSQLIGSRENVQ